MNQNDIAYMAGLFDGEGSVDYKQRWEKRGKKKHKVVLIPPGIWFSFTTTSKKSLVANILNNVHSPKETIKLPI